MIKLGVNIDHVATVREARRESFPSPKQAALHAVRGGADGITAHLREDRRHIKERDIIDLKESLSVPLNCEMAATEDILRVVETVKPAWACLVPEKRTELTTEGGLALKRDPTHYAKAIHRLHQAGIKVSLFIEPDLDTVRLAHHVEADAIEIHTGTFARLWEKNGHFKMELSQMREAAVEASRLGLLVNAGHGLNYENVELVAQIFPFHEFNIGFSIVAQSLFVGMEAAVRTMKTRIDKTVCVES